MFWDKTIQLRDLIARTNPDAHQVFSIVWVGWNAFLLHNQTAYLGTALDSFPDLEHYVCL